MRNTYINDIMDSSYPLWSGGALPFPRSCITGLGICVVSDVPVKLTISRVEITTTSVMVVICADDSIAGTAEATPDVSDGYGRLKATETAGLKISGFIKVGIIPENAQGSYTGDFGIDPSCILFMPESVYGFHRSAEINGTEYALNRTLSISTGGLIAFDGTALTASQASDGIELVSRDRQTVYSLVTDVNSIPTASNEHTDETLVLTTEDDDAVLFSVTNGFIPPNANFNPYDANFAAQNDGEVTIVTIYGSKLFPNCYSQDQDMADEAITGGSV